MSSAAGHQNLTGFFKIMCCAQRKSLVLSHESTPEAEEMIPDSADE